MYRLLIVTGDQNVSDMFTAMQGWEKLGYKPPRLRATVEEAVECMGKHHIDAIAVEPSPAYDELFAYLDQYHPELPMFQIASSADAQLLILQELSSLLSRLKADDSNDDRDPAFNMQIQRDRWLKKLVAGLVPSQNDLCRQMQLYRFNARVDLPCVLAQLAMSDEDGFMSERWHYGSERLETALRNFFGHSYSHMLIHVAVISPEEVRVLCYPSSADYGVSENIAFDFVQETLEQIENYLGLHMTVTNVYRMSGIRELCSGN